MPENNNHPSVGAITPETAALGCLNAAISGQVGVLLTIPVPVTDVMNLLVEHTMKLLSLVEPEQLRNTILGEIRRNLPAVLNRHVEARLRTPGGVIVPKGVGRMQ